MQQELNQCAPHSLSLVNRGHAELTGVTDVDCFNEQLIVLATSMGSLTITGGGLNILRFNQQDGSLSVDGEFQTFEYSGKTRRAKNGLLARLFR